MRTLTPAERRAFRAKAHHLHPFVTIGHHGLTPAVLHEIDIALAAHELIKIRVFLDDRAEREALLARICDAMEAAPVQHLGKTLTIWRPAPEPLAPVVEPRKKPSKGARKPGRTPPQVDDRRRRAPSIAARIRAPAATPGRPAARRRRGVSGGTVSSTPRGRVAPAAGRGPAHNSPVGGPRRRRAR